MNLTLKDLLNKETVETLLDTIHIGYYTAQTNKFGYENVNNNNLLNYYKRFYPNMTKDEIYKKIENDNPENTKAIIQYMNSLNYNSLLLFSTETDDNNKFTGVAVVSNTAITQDISEHITNLAKSMIGNKVDDLLVDDLPVVILDEDEQGKLIPRFIQIKESA